MWTPAAVQRYRWHWSSEELRARRRLEPLWGVFPAHPVLRHRCPSVRNGKSLINHNWIPRKKSGFTCSWRKSTQTFCIKFNFCEPRPANLLRWTNSRARMMTTGYGINSWAYESCSVVHEAKKGLTSWFYTRKEGSLHHWTFLWCQPVGAAVLESSGDA